MISAFKRLVKTDTGASPPDPSKEPAADAKSAAKSAVTNSSFLNNGVQMISQSLQKKFSKGVNYNMKIVIKGDYNVGKTSLWLRLQGQTFQEHYESSDEIKVANINWNYKLTDDVVKVEVWDVVDRSKKKRVQQSGVATSTASLKLDNSEPTPVKIEPSLDAEFIDVYKNAHGCIMVYDITKQWTWDYVERELPKIPAHLPVLVIGNHRDMHHHRTVDELKCKFFLESLNRGSLGSTVRYTETSMRSGFGLAYLYKFFNIPFLQLRREMLMQQLEINAKEMDNICEELQHMEEGIEAEYDAFSNRLNTQRRQQQEENAKDVLKNAKSVEEARKLAAEKEAAALAAEQAAAANMNEPKKIINQLITKVIPPTSQPAPVSMSVTIDPNAKTGKLNLAAGVKSSMSLQDVNASRNMSKSPNSIKFSEAQDDEFNRFLEESVKTSNAQLMSPSIQNQDEDDDDAGNNPMVAAFKETLDSSDEDLATINKKLASIPAQLDPEDNPSEDHIFKNDSNHSEMRDSMSSGQLLSIASENSVERAHNLVESEPAAQLQLNNDDFAFLESLSSSIKASPSSNGLANKQENGKKSDKKKSKEKKSTDEKSSEKKKKKSSNAGGKSSETESVDSRASQSKSEKKTKSKKSKKESANLASYYAENEEDEDQPTVSIKKDIDYEEL